MTEHDAAARERSMTADEWAEAAMMALETPLERHRDELSNCLKEVIANTVREAQEQARAEEREQQIARFMRIVNDADERLRIRSDIHPDCHGGIQAVLAEIVQSVRSVDDPLLCSFCAKSQDQVERLVAGPTVLICNECVEVTSEILEQERQRNEAPND